MATLRLSLLFPPLRAVRGKQPRALSSVLSAVQKDLSGLSGDFFKDFIYFTLRERGREEEREGEKHQCVRDTSIGCLSHTPNWGPGPQPGMCPKWESDRQPFTSQADGQSTEPTSQGYRGEF